MKLKHFVLLIAQITTIVALLAPRNSFANEEASDKSQSVISDESLTEEEIWDLSKKLSALMIDFGIEIFEVAKIATSGDGIVSGKSAKQLKDLKDEFQAFIDVNRHHLIESVLIAVGCENTSCMF